MARKTIPIEQLSKETRQLFDVLNEQSDLVCVVVGAAFLDTTLGTLLAGRLSESSVSQKVLGPSGALGTFNARADIAYCLGLLRKSRYQDLCVIGEIRNEFAHSHMQLSFGEPQVRALCERLNEWRVAFDDGPTVDASSEGLRARARNQFNLSVVLIANCLVLDGLALNAGHTA